MKCIHNTRIRLFTHHSFDINYNVNKILEKKNNYSRVGKVCVLDDESNNGGI